MDRKSLLFYVGTYADEAAPGIYLCRLDPANGILTKMAEFAGGPNPSFLALHPTGRYLYAVNETGTFHEQPGGGVSAFTIEAATGALTLLNQQSAHGEHPCHLTTDAQGRYALVANYSSGSLAVYPLAPDGYLAPASAVVQHHGQGPHPERQAGPHAHGVQFDGQNRFALVCDLGLDKVLTYRLDFEQGGLQLHGETHVAPGAGPRHLAFHPQGHCAYVINELASTVTVLAYDGEQGRLTELQTLTTLPSGYADANICAEIAVHPAGKFVYASNRGHDSIAIYGVAAEDGRLTLNRFEPTQGHAPRSFAIDPSGKFLIAANQDSDDLVSFRIDAATGRLHYLQRLELPKPVCLKFW